MITVAPEVAAALAAGQPIVALESTIVSHGLPRPDNIDIARQIEQAVRDGGAVPATIALVDGAGPAPPRAGGRRGARGPGPPRGGGNPPPRGRRKGQPPRPADRGRARRHR